MKSFIFWTSPFKPVELTDIHNGEGALFGNEKEGEIYRYKNDKNIKFPIAIIINQLESLNSKI